MYQSHGSYGNLETVGQICWTQAVPEALGGLEFVKETFPKKRKKQVHLCVAVVFCFVIFFVPPEGLCKHLGGGNSHIFFIFTPKPGEDSHSDDYIFQFG